MNIENSIDSILRLIQEMSIVSGKLYNSELDSQVYVAVDNIKILGKETVSIRDIVKKLTMIFKVENDLSYLLFNNYQYVTKYPREYLLFNCLLEALNGDFDEARMHLDLSYSFLGLNENFKDLLSVILNYGLNDRDLREFFLVLAYSIQPLSAHDHVDLYGEKYKKRFENYLNELDGI